MSAVQGRDGTSADGPTLAWLQPRQTKYTFAGDGDMPQSYQILPPIHSFMHLSRIVMSFVPRPNSTTCPNAAGNLQVPIFIKQPNFKPPT